MSDDEAVSADVQGLRTERGYRARRNLWSGSWAIELEPGMCFNLDFEGRAELIELLQACNREDAP